MPSTTEPGYQNHRNQKVVGPNWRRGTDHNSRAYVLECQHCGWLYRANGTDIHERRCPKCQDGRPGLELTDEL
jgi:rubredoxin